MVMSLKPRLEAPGLLHVMAAHSPLSARLAEEAGFDGLWASGFELSALYGLADASLLSLSQHLDMVRAMAGQTRLPIVADIDTGYGNAVNVDHVVREYERAGASSVVIEDKSFPKVTSLLAEGRQELVRIEEFAGKIQAALAARQSPDFLIIARTEALIAGLGEDEALRRCRAYQHAGADMILVHSKSKTPDEIEHLVQRWDGVTPIVIVPTAYPDLTAERIAALGKIKMVIYGNHAIRASITAMQKVFATIVQERGIKAADREIVPVSEVFRLQRMDDVKRLEERFLR
jgi:phosphoenolpyruvate phosphomutase